MSLFQFPGTNLLDRELLVARCRSAAQENTFRARKQTQTVQVGNFRISVGHLRIFARLDRTALLTTIVCGRINGHSKAVHLQRCMTESNTSAYSTFHNDNIPPGRGAACVTNLIQPTRTSLIKSGPNSYWICCRKLFTWLDTMQDWLEYVCLGRHCKGNWLWTARTHWFPTTIEIILK